MPALNCAIAERAEGNDGNKRGKRNAKVANGIHELPFNITYSMIIMESLKGKQLSGLARYADQKELDNSCILYTICRRQI